MDKTLEAPLSVTIYRRAVVLHYFISLQYNLLFFSLYTVYIYITNQCTDYYKDRESFTAMYLDEVSSYVVIVCGGDGFSMLRNKLQTLQYFGLRPAEVWATNTHTQTHTHTQAHTHLF